MCDAALVRRADGVGQRDRNLQQLVERQAAGGDRLGQRPTIDQLQRQECAAVGLLDRVNRHNVRVIERGGCAGFEFETLPAVGVGGQVTREDLQRDLPPQPRIFGKKDLAHAALAQQFENLVVPESLPDHFRSFRAMQGCRRMVPSPPTGRSAAWSPYCPIGSLQWT